MATAAVAVPTAKPSSPGIPPAAAEVAVHPDRLDGLRGSDVVAVLGRPSYRRRESPAEVWQYYGPGCILDVFLYENPDGLRVAHVELRGRNPGQAAEAGCLSALVEARRDRPTS